MGAAIAPREVKITLQDLAREELDKVNGDREKASANLKTRLRHDRDLFELVIDQAISMASTLAIASVIGAQRESIVRAVSSPRPDVGEFTVPHKPAPTPPAKVSVLAQARIAKAASRNSMDRLMEFPLTNGMMLGRATKQIVLEQAMKFVAPVKSHVTSHAFLKLVGEAMDDDKTVRQQFDENDLRDFRAAAEKKADKIMGEIL